VCADLTTSSGAFSVVLSAFGVMYGPRQDRAAGAVARCCEPGARVVLAGWAPDSFMPAMGATLGPYLPAPPPGGGPPARWGDPEGARGLLAPHDLSVTEAVPSSLPLSFADRGAAVAFLLATPCSPRSRGYVNRGAGISSARIWNCSSPSGTAARAPA
jgi:hypothetical protein